MSHLMQNVGTIKTIEYHSDTVSKICLVFSDAIFNIHCGSKLGKGAFGTVYEGRLDTDTPVDNFRFAVKVSKGRASQLQNEIHVMQSITGHENIVSLYYAAVDESSEQSVLVMERCLPVTLHQFVERSGALKAPEALFLIRQAMTAIHHLHTRGCCHFDIKLQNFVFCATTGNLKLIDFGLACPVNVPPATGGTAAFMSPEMARNALKRPSERGNVGAAADIWSLGICIFVLATAQSPYSTDVRPDAPKGSHADATLQRVANLEWRWPRGQKKPDPVLSTLVEKLLREDPNQRPQLSTLLSDSMLWKKSATTLPASIAAFVVSEGGEIEHNAKGNHKRNRPLLSTANTKKLKPEVNTHTSPNDYFAFEQNERKKLLRQQEFHRSYLVSRKNLCLEHSEEIKNIWWLEEAQRKYAKHPSHKLQQFFKFQKGLEYICDDCSATFHNGYKYVLPGTGSYYECTKCKMQLCPPCYDRYIASRTCGGCGVVCLNLTVLETHVCATPSPPKFNALANITNVPPKSLSRSRAASVVSKGDEPSYQNRPAPQLKPLSSLTGGGNWEPFQLEMWTAREGGCQPTMDEQTWLLDDQWVRHFRYVAETTEQTPGFSYVIQPDATGFIFGRAVSDCHSAVLDQPSRRMLIVRTVNQDGNDFSAYVNLDEVAQHKWLEEYYLLLTRLAVQNASNIKEKRAPGQMSVFQRNPQSRFFDATSPDDVIYVRFVSHNNDSGMTMTTLSNGRAQVFGGNFELRWKDRNRMFLVCPDGHCELVNQQKLWCKQELKELLKNDLMKKKHFS